MTFHDRVRELALIKKAIERPYCIIVLTGRRRIGKTRLVREALSGTDHIELFIPRKRQPLAIETLKDSIKEQTGFSPDFKRIGDVVEYLLTKERKVLFIDEISNLMKVEPGAFTDLQRIIDAHKESASVHLIMDGSYMSMMKKLFQNRKEPLFGRATDLIELGPLPIKDSILMAQDQGFAFKDALEAVSIMGGVPRYLELLSSYRDMKDLKVGLFSPGSIFLTEGENLLIQEFGASWDTYFSVLEVISRGGRGPSSIANDIGMPVQMLTKYLSKLMGMRLVIKESPIFGKKGSVRYRLNDPFLDLWFKVCYPRIEFYRDGISTVPKEQMDTAIGRAMESLVREMVRSLPFLPFDIDGIGPWWNRSGDEIDIVAYSKKEHKVAFGEVKWTKGQVTPKVVSSLLDKVKKVDWHVNDRIERPFIVSMSGFTEKALEIMKANTVVGLDLDDLKGTILSSRKPDWPLQPPL